MKVRLIAAAVMVVLPVICLAVWQLTLWAMLAILAVLLIVAIVVAYALHALAAQDAPIPVALPARPTWVDATPGETTLTTLVVPDDLNNTITGLLNRQELTEKQVKGLIRFVMDTLGPQAAAQKTQTTPTPKRTRRDKRPMADLLRDLPDDGAPA